MTTNNFTLLFDPETFEKVPTFLTKKFKKTEEGVIKTPFGNAYNYGVRVLDFSTQEKIFRFLEHFRSNPRVCLVRDQPTHKKAFTRRIKEFFEQQDSFVAMCDIDGLELPFQVDPRKSGDLDQIESFLREKYRCLRDVTFILQFSSSAFLAKPLQTNAQGDLLTSNRLCAHIWVRFDKAICAESLKDFYNAFGFDASLAHPVQVHYFADPVFEGVSDPLAYRLRLCKGSHEEIKTSELPMLLQNKAEWEKEQERKRIEAEKKAKKAVQTQKQQETLLLTEAKTVGRHPQNLVNEIKSAREGARNETASKKGFALGICLRSFSPEEQGVWLGKAEDALRVISEGNDLKNNLNTLHRAFQAGLASKDTSSERPRSIKKAPGWALKETSKEWTPEFLPSIEPINDRWGCFYAVKASMGTGKTHRFAEFVRNTGLNTLIVTPTRSLAHGAVTRFDCVCYEDLEGSTFKAPRLSVCLDSIHKVTGHYDIVILDEFHQTAPALLKEFSGKNVHFELIFTHLQKRVQDAAHVLVGSANLEAEDIALLKRLDKNKRVEAMEHFSENPNEHWEFFVERELFDFVVVEALERGLRFPLFSASKKRAETWKNLILQHHPKTRVVVHHSEQEESAREILKNPEEWQNYDVVIFTTTAGTGVDFSIRDHFDLVFLDGSGVTFDYTHFEQASKRVRHTKTSKVVAYIPEKNTEFFTREEILDRVLTQERQTLATMGVHAKPDLYDENVKDALSFYVEVASLQESRKVRLKTQLQLSLVKKGIVFEEVENAGVVNQISIDENKKKISEVTKKVTEEDVKRTVEAVVLDENDVLLMENRDLSSEEARSLKKFRLVNFYGEISEEIVKSDQDGKLRTQLKNRSELVCFDESPEHFLEKDRNDMKGGKRKMVSAKNHYQKAEFKHTLARILVHHHPEWNSFLPMPLKLEENFDVLEETRKFYAKFKHLLSKRMISESNLEKFLGEMALSIFGMRRVCKKVTVGKAEDGSLIRKNVYSVNLEHEELLARLGREEARRCRLEIALIRRDFEMLQTESWGGVSPQKIVEDQDLLLDSLSDPQPQLSLSV